MNAARAVIAEFVAQAEGDVVAAGDALVAWLGAERREDFFRAIAPLIKSTPTLAATIAEIVAAEPGDEERQSAMLLERLRKAEWPEFWRRVRPEVNQAAGVIVTTLLFDEAAKWRRRRQ